MLLDSRRHIYTVKIKIAIGKANPKKKKKIKIRIPSTTNAIIPIRVKRVGYSENWNATAEAISEFNKKNRLNKKPKPNLPSFNVLKSGIFFIFQ